MSSENYEKALALCLSDRVPEGMWADPFVADLKAQVVKEALDDLGLKLVPLRGGSVPEDATHKRGSRRPGESP